MNQNWTVTCQTAKLTLQTSGPGTVARSPAGSGSGPDSCSANPATSVTLTATPGAGYAFDIWTVDGAAAGTKGNPNLTLTMNSDHTVIATFVQTWKLTINVVGSGSVGVASSPAASGSNPYTLNNGTAVTLTPTAAAGYGFVGWTVQVGSGAASSSTTTPLGFTMTNNYTVTATFAQRTLTTSTAGAGSGTITTPGVGTYTYSHGTTLQVTASETLGSIFVGWMVDGAAGGSTKTISVTMTQNHTVVANFAKANSLNVTASGGAGSTVVSSNGASGAAGGTVTSPGTATYTFATTDSITITVTPAANTMVASWTDNGTTVNGTATTYTVSMGNGHDIAVTFVATWALTLTPSPSAGGALVAAPVPPSGGRYLNGDVVAVSYTTTLGYVFVKWQFDGVDAGNAATLSVTMDASHAVTAVFNSVGTATLKLSAGTGGQVSPSGTTTWTKGSLVALTATPDANYSFDGWYEGNSSTPLSTALTFQVTMNAAHTITGKFHRNYTLIVSASPSQWGSAAPAGVTIWAAGDTATVTATPTSPYLFTGWTVDGSANTSVTLTLTMNADHTVVANFGTPFACPTNSTFTVCVSYDFNLVAKTLLKLPGTIRMKDCNQVTEQ